MPKKVYKQNCFSVITKNLKLGSFNYINLVTFKRRDVAKGEKC